MRTREALRLLDAAVSLIKPGYVTDIVGASTLSIVLLNQILLKPAKAAPVRRTAK